MNHFKKGTPEHYYQRFLQEYQGQCLKFVEKVIGVKPTVQQKELLIAFDEPHARIAVRSGHGTGKSTAASWIVLYTAFCYPNSRVIVTSASLDNLKTTLWPELQNWFDKIKNRQSTAVFGQWFDITRTMFYHKVMNKTWFAVLRTARPENPQSIAGQHARCLVYLVDEASSLAQSPELFDVINGALTSGPLNKLLLIGNPTANYGEFYEAFHSKRNMYMTLHWNAENSPVVSNRAIERFRREYGESSPEYFVRVRGDFAPDPKGMLISRMDIERCIDNKDVRMDWPSGVVVSDVAGDGRDSSVIIVLQLERSTRMEDELIVGCEVKHEMEYQSMGDTMFLANEIKRLSEEYGNIPIVVDGIGVGKGVVDRLLELDMNVVPFIAGSRPDEPRRFYNARAECYHRLKILFERKKINIPLNYKLCDQLSNIPFKYDEKGRLKIESKDKMLGMGLKSPDLADCLMMGMFNLTHVMYNKQLEVRNETLLEEARKKRVA